MAGDTKLTIARRYALALIAVIAAVVAARVLVAAGAQDVAPLAFPMAVLFVAGFEGLGPGLTAAVLSVAASAFFMFSPVGSFVIDSERDRETIAAVGALTLVLSAALGSIHSARRLEGRIAKAVSASERDFRLLFEANPEPMAVVDEKTLRFVAVNQAAIDVYEYSRDEFLKLTAFDLRFPEDVPFSAADLERHLPLAQVFKPAVWRLRTKDGEEIFVDVSASRLVMEGITRWLVLARDVTEKVRRDDAMRDAEEKWRAILEGSNEHYVVVDAEDRVGFVNRPFPGFTEEDVRGHVIYEFVAPGQVAQLRSELDTVRRTGVAMSFEAEVRRVDGTTMWCEGRYVPIKRDNAVKMTLVIFTDVSRRREKGEELTRAKAAAESASGAKDRFIAALSHELRTPLTPVLAAVSSAQSRFPELASTFAMIRRNVELEARLIDDLLDVSRVVNGKLIFEPRLVDLHALVREVMELCSDQITTKRLRVRTDLAAREPWVCVDPARIQQVLWNVVENAVKFAPSGGAVTVRSRDSDGKIAISVSDNGSGIPKEDLDRIFLPFEQSGDNARGRGLGLGLAISKGIVDAAGGTLAAESSGDGATFTIELPLHAPPVRSAVSEDVHPPASSTHLRILLVEDDPDTREILGDLLRQYDYEVSTADGVATALEEFERAPFDLLISDIGLPDGSGIELVRTLHERRPIRAIALSGYGTAEDARRSNAAGFVAHVTKPISREGLEAAIRDATA